jgi:hypothetical protein
MTDEFYEAFERFCIIAESEGDWVAVYIVQKMYGAGIAQKIIERYIEKGKRNG